MSTAHQQAVRLMNGFRIYQAVVAACRLKLPDLLAKGPKSSVELAAATGTHADSLHRLLRGLVAAGLFAVDADGRYRSTEVSEFFRSDRPGLRNRTVMLSEEAYSAWAEVMHTLRTGEPAFHKVHGMSRWEHLAQDPAKAATFNRAMIEMTSRVAQDFVAAYDCSGARTVVDVGGGNGELLAAVLAANPDANGILYDLPAGLAGAKERMVRDGLDGRVTLVEGSFLESVPEGGDLYLLKSIIHDWDEEHDRVILENCRRAMHKDSKVVLVERHLPDQITRPDEYLEQVMSDLNMMVVLGGRERTEVEYRDLLAASHLRMTRGLELSADWRAFEAVVQDPV